MCYEARPMEADGSLPTQFAHDLGKIASEEVAGNGDVRCFASGGDGACPVSTTGDRTGCDIGGGDDADFAAGVVAVERRRVVERHAEQRWQRGFSSGAGEQHAVSASAGGSAVAG